MQSLTEAVVRSVALSTLAVAAEQSGAMAPSSELVVECSREIGRETRRTSRRSQVDVFDAMELKVFRMKFTAYY